MNPKNKVLFFQIKDIKIKLIRLIQTAMYHFEKKEKLLIRVADEASLKFVDELLWRQPQEGFLPHSISEDKCEDYIVITKSNKNLNGAHFLFNLSQDIIDLDTAYTIIYDFDDFTSLKKQEKSKKRFNIYRQANLRIESS